MIEKIFVVECGICGWKLEVPEWDWVSNSYSRFKCEECGRLRYFSIFAIKKIHTSGEKTNG